MEKHKVEVGVLRRAAFLPELRSVNLETRTVDCVASTPEPDRYGDILRPEGFQLDNFRRNPVFLFSHKSDEPPIGRCLKVWTEKSPPALCQTIQFADFPFASLIFDLYAQGFMRAISVGFLPLEAPTPITDEEGHFSGYEFKNQDLLESSAVAIPANPSCVARMVSKGFSEADLERAFSGTPQRQEPAEPPEDEPAGSVAETAEELGEALDELAVGVADAQKLCAVLISQLEPGAAVEEDSAKPTVAKQGGNVSEILARIVEDTNRLDSRVAREAQPSAAADETDITSIEELGEALKDADTIASVEELAESESTFTSRAGSRKWRDVR